MSTDDRPGRACARGCVYPGRHRTMCAETATCPGCLPVLAADHALICPRCITRLRSTIADAPDLCQYLRTLIAPLRAQVYQTETLKRGRPSEPPSPVNVDAIDAGNEVVTILSWWAGYFGDDTVYRLNDGFLASTTPEEAHAIAQWAADYFAYNLDRIVNDSFVVLFSRSVIDLPEDKTGWTIRKALNRFPLESRAAWSTIPCPGCQLRSIRVTPPRAKGEHARYLCRACNWSPPDVGREFWINYFERTTP